LNNKKRMAIFKQATEPDTLDIYIYGNVTDDYYELSGDKVTSDTSAKYVRDELAKYPDVKQINIYINSPGGCVFEGTAIYTQLKRHPAQKTIYIDGFACSIAAVIAMCGDKVIMPSNTMMMIHNIWMCAIGNSEQLRKAADDLDVMMKSNRQAFLAKSNGKITESKLIKLLEAETWLTADDCVKYGFCDEITSAKQDLSQQKQKIQGLFKTKLAAEADKDPTKRQTEKFIKLVAAITPGSIISGAMEKANKN
jgi:ATP-dependent Clp protease protease subunit